MKSAGSFTLNETPLRLGNVPGVMWLVMQCPTSLLGDLTHSRCSLMKAWGGTGVKWSGAKEGDGKRWKWRHL